MIDFISHAKSLAIMGALALAIVSGLAGAAHAAPANGDNGSYIASGI